MVENVLEIRRGHGLIGAVIGVVGGAISSVLPLEFAFGVAVPCLVLDAVCLVDQLSRRRVSTWTATLLVFWVAVMVAANAAPMKWIDEPVPAELSATTLTVAQLSAELDLRAFVNDPSEISLPSRRPTWRELRTAIDTQTHWDLRLGGCGTGASLLFGNFPMGKPALVTRSAP